MPFNNDIAGGNGSLVRNWLQSSNFVTGVSGWQIRKDGTAEFNNGTFRGSLQVGTAPGQRFIVNPGNGDVLDVYDASNHLIANIDSQGQYTNYQFVAGSPLQHTQYGLQGLIYFSDVDSSDAIMEFTPSNAGQPSSQALWQIQVANNNPGVNFEVYTLQVFAGSDNATHKPTMIGTERGISGSIVQSSGTSQSNLLWSGDVTGTTDASGNLVITHGAGFTPNRVFVQVHDTGNLGSTFGVATVVNGSANSTTFQIHCVGFNGTVRTNASVSVYYLVLG